MPLCKTLLRGSRPCAGTSTSQGGTHFVSGEAFLEAARDKLIEALQREDGLKAELPVEVSPANFELQLRELHSMRLQAAEGDKKRAPSPAAKAFVLFPLTKCFCCTPPLPQR